MPDREAAARRAEVWLAAKWLDPAANSLACDVLALVEQLATLEADLEGALDGGQAECERAATLEQERDEMKLRAIGMASSAEREQARAEAAEVRVAQLEEALRRIAANSIDGNTVIAAEFALENMAGVSVEPQE